MSLMRIILVVLVLGILGGGSEHLGSFFDQVGQSFEDLQDGGQDAQAHSKHASRHGVKGYKRAGNPEGCHVSKRPQRITFSEADYPNIIAHIRQSWREGYPKVLHVNRAGATGRRDALLADIPTREGYDRDEAPAAALRSKVKADVMYVPYSENRSAGSSLSHQIDDLCNGSKVRYHFVP